VPRDSHCLGHHPNHCPGHRLVILSSSPSVALSLTSCHLGHCHSRHRSHRRSYCHSRRLAIALASSLWPLPRASSQLSSAVAPIAATLPPISPRRAQQLSSYRLDGLSSHRLGGLSSSAAIASTVSAAITSMGSAAIAPAGSAAVASMGSAAIALMGSAAQQL
jgi:hypothetical protein